MTRTHRMTLPRPSVLDIKPEHESGVVKSAQRVFEILELFERLQRPARVAEIVELTDIPQSSASMLLRSMLKLGYLNWNPESRTYTPSLRVNMLGGWVHDEIFPRSLLRLAMQEISEKTGLTVVLGQPNNRFVRYAHVIMPNNEWGSYIHLGMERPLIGSSLGFALLSGLDDELITRIAISTLNSPYQTQGTQSLDQVHDTIKKVRQLGYAYSTRHTTPGDASFSFLLKTWPQTQKPVLYQERLFGLAIAGRQYYVEQHQETALSVINYVITKYLPDVHVQFNEHSRIEKI